MATATTSGLVRVAAAAWAGAIGVGLAVGASGSARWRDALLDDGPGCVFHAATGVNCPFCGMTHATIALGAGDWRGALASHPLAPIVVVGMLAIMIAIAVGRGDLLTRGRRIWWLLGAIAAIWIARLIIERL